jgi:hypothetical protein
MRSAIARKRSSKCAGCESPPPPPSRFPVRRSGCSTRPVPDPTRGSPSAPAISRKLRPFRDSSSNGCRPPAHDTRIAATALVHCAHVDAGSRLDTTLEGSRSRPLDAHRAIAPLERDPRPSPGSNPGRSPARQASCPRYARQTLAADKTRSLPRKRSIARAGHDDVTGPDEAASPFAYPTATGLLTAPLTARRSRSTPPLARATAIRRRQQSHL